MSENGTQGPSRAGSNAGWVVAAVVTAAAGVGLWLSRESPPSPPAPPAMGSPAAPVNAAGWRPVQQGAAQGLPMAQGMPPPAASPRDQADSLFNVVMAAAEQKDQATVAQALPQALAAYRQLSALDDDGTFHVALLHLTGGQFSEARATAQQLLAANPNHLLALSVAARAAAATGDAAAARDFNQRLVRAYDSERTRPLTEYQDHQRVLPIHKAEAEAALKQ